MCSIQPEYDLEDLEDTDSKNFKPDPITKIMFEPKQFGPKSKYLASHHSPIIVGQSNWDRAPAHLACNPELPLDTIRIEIDEKDIFSC